MFGLLNLNKPAGVTSRHVVDQVQRLVRPDKVGHAGTLDPLARGVLVVGVGAATRLVEYVQSQRKTYHAEFLLGRSSTTEDIEGDVTLLPDAPVPTLFHLQQATEKLLGRISQRPPIFSALKVDGQRAYTLARAGEEVELSPRPIDVYSITIIEYDYPRLVVDIECGSGTYVRSLGRDLGESVGNNAVMSALLRTAIGPFRLADALDPETLTRSNIAESILPATLGVSHLPTLQLTGDEAGRIAHGLTIQRTGLSEIPTEYAATDAAGVLLAILAPRGPETLGPVKCFPRSG